MTAVVLSPQQTIIFQGLIDGMTIKEIENAMGIKKSTIRKYIQRARLRLGAKTLYQCIAILSAEKVINVSFCEDSHGKTDG